MICPGVVRWHAAVPGLTSSPAALRASYPIPAERTAAWPPPAPALRRPIALCKQRLPLPDLLVRLGLFRNPPGPGSHPCPLRRERKGAAFSMHHRKDTWLWMCHGKCAASGDEISFLQILNGTNRRAAIERYKELCGHPASADCIQPARLKATRPIPTLPTQAMIQFPDRLHSGSYSDCERVAKLREVPTGTVLQMARSGLLAFGNVCGLPSWLVLDASRKLAEGRRMDGSLYPAAHGLSERKTHTLRGSQKNWPLGLATGTGPVLLVEGSGDFVAAHYFCSFTRRSSNPWQPVALLGASVKTIHSDAVPLIRGRRVRIVPHADPAGAKAGLQWAGLLKELGCRVDGFDLRNLAKTDGSPVKDLNDCTAITPGAQTEMNQLFT